MFVQCFTICMLFEQIECETALKSLTQLIVQIHVDLLQLCCLSMILFRVRHYHLNAQYERAVNLTLMAPVHHKCSFDF
jgi:hypothetical protein